MGPHGSPWVPMGPHGFPMGPHGSPWVPYRCLVIFIDFYMTFTDIYRSSEQKVTFSVIFLIFELTNAEHLGKKARPLRADLRIQKKKTYCFKSLARQARADLRIPKTQKTQKTNTDLLYRLELNRT